MSEASEWVSAVATVGATMVALFQPGWMAKRQKQDVDAERTASLDRAVTEIVAASLGASSAFSKAEEYVNSADENVVEYLRVREIEELGLRAQRVLDLLLRRSDLTDGVVRLAVDAMALGTETGNVMSRCYGGGTKLLEAKGLAVLQKGRALRVAEQIETVKSFYNIREVQPR